MGRLHKRHHFVPLGTAQGSVDAEAVAWPGREVLCLLYVRILDLIQA